MSTVRSSSAVDEMAARRIVVFGIGLLVVAIFGIQLVRSAFLVLLLPVLAYAFLFLTAPRYAIYVLMAAFSLVGLIPWMFPSIGFLTSGFFSVTTGLSLISGFLGVIYFLLTKSNPFRYRITVPFLLFLVVATLSGYFSVDRLLALRRLTKFFCSWVLTLVVAESFSRREHIHQMWKVILWLSLIPIGVSVFQIVTGRMPYYMGLGMTRLFGTFSHPNEFGLYLVILCNIALALAFLSPGGRLRVIYLGFFLALGACLVLTRSRGAWIGFFVMLSVMCVMVRRKGLLLLIIGASGVVVLMSPATLERIVDQARAGSFEWRIHQWQLVFPYFQRNPLLGVGLESSYVSWIFGASYSQAITTAAGSAAAVHNTHLQVLVETGIFGYAAILWTMLTMAWIPYRAWRRFRDDPVLGMSCALVFGFMVSFILMALNWSLFGAPGREIWFWFLAGIGEALYRLAREETVSAEEAASVEETASVEAAAAGAVQVTA